MPIRVALGGWLAALAIALALSLALAPAAGAHHSYVGDYDGARTVTLKGVIGDVEYRNPHIFFTLETADGSWRIETESIPRSQGKGLNRTDLAPGARVTVVGWPARGGAKELGLSSIVLANGRAVRVRGTPR